MDGSRGCRRGQPGTGVPAGVPRQPGHPRARAQPGAPVLARGCWFYCCASWGRRGQAGSVLFRVSPLPTEPLRTSRQVGYGCWCLPLCCSAEPATASPRDRAAHRGLTAGDCARPQTRRCKRRAAVSPSCTRQPHRRQRGAGPCPPQARVRANTVFICIVISFCWQKRLEPIEGKLKSLPGPGKRK